VYAVPLATPPYFLHAYTFDQYQISGNEGIPYDDAPSTYEQVSTKLNTFALCQFINKTLTKKKDISDAVQDSVFAGRSNKQKKLKLKYEKKKSRVPTTLHVLSWRTRMSSSCARCWPRALTWSQPRGQTPPPYCPPATRLTANTFYTFFLLFKRGERQTETVKDKKGANKKQQQQQRQGQIKIKRKEAKKRKKATHAAFMPWGKCRIWAQE